MKSFLPLSLVVVALTLIGCGGGGLNPVSVIPGDTAPLRTAPAEVTARIDYNPNTGEVRVTNFDEPTGRAAFGGSAVRVTEAVVTEVAGSTSNVRLLELTVDNKTGYDLLNPNILMQVAPAAPVVNTLAGTGVSGSTDGAASAATLGGPNGVWQDADGTIFVTQIASGSVRRIKNGVVTTIASGLSRPMGITGNPNSDYIYFTDQTAHRVYRFRKDGVQGQIIAGNTAGDADGPGASARFNNPMGLTRDNAGTLYVCDYTNGKVRRIVDPDGSPIVYTITTMSNPYGISYGGFEGRPGLAITSQTTGNVYLYDISAGALRLIKSLSPNISGVAVLDNRIAVSNQTTHQLTIIRAALGANPFQATSWANESIIGSGAGFANGVNARFNNPLHLGTGAADELLLADNSGNRVRTIELPTLLPGNSAQTTQFINPSFTLPGSVAGYAIGPLQPNTFRKVKMSFSVPYPAAMSFYVTVDASSDLQIPPDAQTGAPSDNVVVRSIAGSLTNQGGFSDGIGPNARFSNIFSVAAAPNGELFVLDGSAVRIVTKQGATYTIVGALNSVAANSGNGRANYPSGVSSGLIASDTSDVFYYVTFSGVYRVYNSGNRYNAGSWYFNRIAGADTSGDVLGIGSVARFAGLYSGFFEPISATLFIADYQNHKVKSIRYLSGNIDSDANWYVLNVAGSTSGFADGAAPQFNQPTSVAAAPGGGFFVADYSNQRIRLVTPEGSATTVAGTGSIGNSDGAVATFTSPFHVSSDSAGNLYVAEDGGYSLRVLRSGRVESVLRFTSGTATDGTGSQFRNPNPIRVVAVDPQSGDLWIADRYRIMLVQRIVR
ncbi:MAG: SMP-30/gluconolactonase/LRE family protein [Fimbriimonadaceae bacterium]|nr:SMP-30/gluconolactonase/LRE family protein [Fimbriimonadaceae bacterium]